MRNSLFKKTIWDYYAHHGRRLPWRNTTGPYRILVSEIMLQQTRVDRVIPKYKAFTKRFPNFKQLANAKQKDVLTLWQGLGYNRRALYLYRIAKIVTRDFGGRLPREHHELIKLPGIGPYTASAIRVFAWNKPDILIETNIRTVFLHHFFSFPRSFASVRRRSAQGGISDKEILPLIAKHLKEQTSPRLWYAALMDYGAHIKRTVGNPNVRSKHYIKQSGFEGSNRQVRGNILKTLIQKPVTLTELLQTVEKSEAEVIKILKELEKEGFIKEKRQHIALT